MVIQKDKIGMTNREKFKEVFNLCIPELWIKSMKELLEWADSDYKEISANSKKFKCDKCGYEYWSFSIYYPTNSYIQDEDEIERYVSDEHFETDTEAFIAAKEGIDYEINNNR